MLDGQAVPMTAVCSEISPLFQRAESNYTNTFPGNTFIIGDPAYAARRWIAPTLKKGAAATLQKRRYSKAIATGRVVIEQAISDTQGQMAQVEACGVQR